MNRFIIGAEIALVSMTAFAAQPSGTLSQRDALERISPLTFSALTAFERERGAVVSDGELKDVLASQEFQDRYAATLKEFCRDRANAATLACAPAVPAQSK